MIDLRVAASQRIRSQRSTIIAFCPINGNNCSEILHFNTPDSFHAQLWILKYLDLLDAMLRQACRWPTNRAQVEAPVLLAGLPHLCRAIALGQHDHAAAMALE